MTKKRGENDDVDSNIYAVLCKYAARYREGTNLVLLEPDIAAAFPTEKAVNDALRLVIRLNQIQEKTKPVSARGAR